MLPERWLELKQEIKQKFDLEDEYSEELDHDGSQEVLEFTSPMGRIKLCFAKNPKVLDKKLLTRIALVLVLVWSIFMTLRISLIIWMPFFGQMIMLSGKK